MKGDANRDPVWQDATTIGKELRDGAWLRPPPDRGCEPCPWPWFGCARGPRQVGPAATPSDRRPSRFHLRLQELTAVTAYDGREGWNVQPFGGRRDPEKSSADDARGLAQQAELDGPLIDWRTKGHRIDYLGIEDVDGTPAIKLRVTRADKDV